MLPHHCSLQATSDLLAASQSRKAAKLTWIRTGLLSLTIVSLVCIIVLVALIVYGSRPKPEAMPSIAEPFESVDYSTLPQQRTLRAGDGAKLAYRHYQGDGDCAVLALHGSATEGRSLHALARRLEHEGIGVYIPDLRGHGNSGQKGDISRRGLLENDIQAFVEHIMEISPEKRLTLLGFSSGGGLALKYAGRHRLPESTQLVMLAPMLGIDSAPYTEDNPHAREQEWARPFVPRLIGLSILNELGIHVFDHLPVIAFAVERDNQYATATYSRRLLASLNPDDHHHLLRNTGAPVTVLAGTHDEVFASRHYEEAVHSARPEARIRLVEGVTHAGMILDPQALEQVAREIAGNGC